MITIIPTGRPDHLSQQLIGMPLERLDSIAAPARTSSNRVGTLDVSQQECQVPPE